MLRRQVRSMIGGIGEMKSPGSLTDRLTDLLTSFVIYQSSVDHVNAKTTLLYLPGVCPVE